MLALMLLVALCIVEVVCRYGTRRPGSGLTSAAHLLLGAMVGMPGMGGGSAMAQGAGLAAHLPSVAAAVVLVIFLVRAGIEGSRAIRAGRDTGVRPIGHVAAVAGALSMVVMCTAMMAI